MSSPLTEKEQTLLSKLADLPVEDIPIDLIRSDGENPNKMTEEQYAGLISHIKKYGIINAVIITENGLLADGEHRLKAAKELGYTTIKARKIPDNEAERRIIRQTMNKIRGKHDAALDAREYQKLIDLDAIVPLSDYLGEDPGELLHVLDKVSLIEKKDPDNFDLDAALDAITTPETKPGDIIRMGDHILICGDCTDPHTWNLLDPQPLSMMMTDPPYNCNIKGKGNGKELTIKNDNLTPAQFRTLISGFLHQAMQHVAGAQYIFMSSEEWPTLHTAFEEAGGRWSTTIIWVKSHFCLSRKDMHPQYEPLLVGTVKETLDPKMKTTAQPILYGWKKGSHRQWYDTRTETDVWVAAKPSRNEVHPTMKPVTLYRKAILLSTKPWDTVADPFCGSGSAVIACEQTHRKCRAIELDPVYCDVIKKRWEQFTGRKAEVIRTGDPLWTQA